MLINQKLRRKPEFFGLYQKVIYFTFVILSTSEGPQQLPVETFLQTADKLFR